MEIYSKIIGTLKQDDWRDDWWHDSWESGEVQIPFFDNDKYKVIFAGFFPKCYVDKERGFEHDDKFIEDADLALENFFKLSTKERIAISKFIYENFAEFLDNVGEEYLMLISDELKNINDIWKYVYPKQIYVERFDLDNEIYITICCECGWEIEHGLQLVFRKGNKLTRVSENDGHFTENDDVVDEVLWE